MTTRIVLTGFGPFGDVSDNPSSELVSDLGKRPRTNFAYIPQIRVSVSGVKEVVQDMLRLEKPSFETVLVHLGVDTSSTRMKCERFAYNEKNFRIPDEDRVTCCNEPIVIGEVARIETPIDLTKIEMLDDRIVVSTDPGKYICNLLYYESLFAGYRSLFIHVPPFAAIPKKEQIDLIEKILDVL